MHQILLVEDNQESCDILTAFLHKTGRYQTTVVHEAQSALLCVEKQGFDLILLDIMLPGMDGVELCLQLRKKLYCPIIFISCLDDDETIVRAMRMGGDDYITKPLRYPVLEAHIEAALRRMRLGSSRISGDIRIGQATLKSTTHTLVKGDEEIYLSPTEFDLLLYFYNNEGTILKFEEIYQHIWKKPSYGDLRTVFTHVRNLRKKLEDDPSNPRHIQTIPRDGYVFRQMQEIR